ncbi:hypothetical protein RDWZM_003057 [Blomia tropicalis]|uniref:RRM domain-containing protein n=1 Tax=Blomia tropicalis TaxID=40697 RepID=A0A9Q0MF40_BLOTA|nr:hypothetical protein RDWZM_003057 [Blomia tropicalis]
MSKLRSSELFEDFQSNFQNLLYFKENNNFTNLIGYCGTSIFTQYYSKGNGINLQSFFSLHQVNKFHDRFQYCIYYAEIIQILHENSMVMCDSNSVLKTMSQFLINDQFRFILNDLDALPRIDSSGIRCGHKQIFGDLVAPEQIWPYTDIPFNESIMPTYTEMIDIWKIPDICHWILGDVPIWSLSKQMLYHIHSQCNYDIDMSNEDSSKNDTSLIVNVNDTQSDIDDHDESNYSDNENDESPKKDTSATKRSRSDDSKRSPHKDSKNRSKVDSSKTRYLWVSGIPDGTKTSQLEELFLQHGKVLAIKIIRGGNDSTLLGFVKLETVEQAQKCMEKLHKTEFRGNKIELFRERPAEKDGKRPEKIGFRDNRKPYVPRPTPPSRSSFRPLHSTPRGSYRTPNKPIHTQHREHSRITPDFRQQEREEYSRLEREKERLKMERIKLERDKAELLKIERESRVFERERIHDDKRVRSIVKRAIDEPYLDEKRFDDYNKIISRREDFGRRYEPRTSSPDRKLNSSRSFVSVTPRGRYEDNGRGGGGGRFSDKFETPAKPWTSGIAESSWVNNDNHRSWQSSNYDTSRLLSNSIGSNSISRLHSGAEISQSLSSRNYFNNGRRY